MIIHIRNEHPNMQANKLNAKYHLHVQHLTDTTIQGNYIKDIKSNKGIRVMYLKKCITLTISNKLQSMGTKQKILNMNLNIYIKVPKALNKSTVNIHKL